MNEKVTGLLGIAARARKLAVGDTLLLAVRQKKAKLVLLAADCSANSQKKIQDKCRFYGVPCILIASAAQLSEAIGQPHRIAAAILDEGLAAGIRRVLEMR